MNSFRPSQVIGGIMGGFDEGDYERETSVSSVLKNVGESVFESLSELGQDLTGVEASEENKKFPSKGSIEFNKAQAKAEEDEKKKAESGQKREFYRNLKDEQLKAQMAKDRMWFEEEINDIAANISTEEKNELLHYQASYKDRSVYQKAELRRKIIEQRRKSEQKQKESSIPNPSKQPSALEGAFEGRSGSQGSGTANLSSQAAG